MDIEGQRRSENFEDRGRGSGGGGGLPLGVLFALVGRLGFRGILIVGALFLVVYFFFPGLLAGVLGGGAGGGSSSGGGQSAGATCEAHAEACDFSRAVLGSTEDVWRTQFQRGLIPTYGGARPGAYQDPTLVVFSDAVNTACGNAPSSVGPFYCPGDRQLYIDPTFYDVMASRLNAPGDFAQAYVIAHEVGHHVQNLIGATQHRLSGENDNQTSVRVELQADCFAGVWGHTARASLSIDDADLREALNAAHSIGDDALQQGSQGRVDPSQFTHGSSAQRVRWFRRGFDSGDARQCDTFSVPYNQL